MAVHASILLAAVVVFPSPDEYEVDETESIPVEIVSIEDFSKRQATVEEPPPEQKPEEPPAPKVKVEPKIEKIEPKPAEEVKQAAREPEPVPAPEPAPQPVPEPVVEEPAPPQPEPLEELIKQTEDPVPEAEPEKVAKAPVPVPRQKPKPPVRKIVEKKKEQDKKFNTDDVAALLNKIDETRAAPSVSEVEGSPKLDDITSLIGSDNMISANELDWLRQRIGQCWNVPAGARDAQNLVVRIRIQMDPLGNVLGQPRIINRSDHPVFDAAARSAVAAVMGCQPYDKLPAEKYESWRDMIINFDPSLMLALN